MRVLGKKGRRKSENKQLGGESAIAEDQIAVVVQVNDKLRDQVIVPVDIDEELLKHLAVSSERVKKFMDGKAIHRVIVVPHKPVNIVVR